MPGVSVAFAAALTYLFFDTPITVIVMAGVDGVVTTLPLLLVVLAGILLSNLLVATGSIERLVRWSDKFFECKSEPQNFDSIEKIRAEYQ